MPEKTDAEKYIETLSEMEKKASKIAQEHLETSYDMEKQLDLKNGKHHKIHHKNIYHCIPKPQLLVFLSSLFPSSPLSIDSRLEIRFPD